MSKSVKVLLVEDSANDAELALQVLRRGGFDVQYERVDSAAAMAEALQRQPWDAVISDFRMPGFTGLDALEVLHGSGFDIPFILVSGTIGEDVAVEAMKAGASDYLMKENLARLAPVLERELNEAALRAEHREAQRHLVESEKRYRDLVENSRDLICTHDLTGKLMSVNEAAVRLTGYSREALLRMNMADLLAAGGRDLFPAYLGEIRKQGVASGVMRIRTAGGEMRWWEYQNTLRTEGVAALLVRGMAHDVTERKQAEEALRVSEARFRALTEMSSDFYWESDVAHRLTMRGSADEKVSAVSVFRQGAQIGQRRWEVPYLSPDEAAWQAHRAVLDAHQPFRDFELSRLGADGSERHIAISGDPLFDDSGAFKGYRGVGTDITERRRAEGELRRLALAVRQSGTGIVITDPAGAIEFVNPKFEAMTGYAFSEVKGKNPRFLKSGAQSREFYRDLWETITAGKEWEGEIQNRKKTGEPYWERQHISPVLDGSGRILHFIAVKDDITERKRAENALRASEEELRTIFDGALDGILVADVESRRFLKGNPAIRRMLGYTPEEITRIGVPDIHPAHALPRAIEQFERLLRGTIPIAADIPVMRKDGSVFYADINAAPIRFGGRQALLGMFRDVSERRQAYEKIKRLNRVYAVLSGIDALIIRVSDRMELYREVCRIAVDLGGFPIAWIGEVDREAMRVNPVAWHGTDERFLGRIRMSIREDAPEGIGVVGRAVIERVPVIANDIERELPGPAKHATERGARSLVVLPLVVSGEGTGVLHLYSDVPGFFDAEEMKLLVELRDDIVFALDHIEKAKKLEFLAYYDPLTGLANRSLFDERLSRNVHAAHGGRRKLALVLADVERLKAINDSLGRQTGDELLRQVARRLARAADPVDIARTGGDQFAILLLQIKGRTDVGRAIEQIWRDCFAQPFQLSDTELRVSAKAGIALFPSDGIHAETLFANAEAALQYARQTGERHQFHTRKLTERVAEQLTLENRLRQALERDEFVLHYQPKVDLDTRRIAGVEALMRWQSPERGLVLPGQFIALMESTGLIQEAGRWALAKAIQDHSRWVALGLPAPFVAVNVSPIQLRRRDFVANLQEAIAAGATPPGIDLEITESIIMLDVEGNIEKLKAIRGLGVSIAIDDFGTGYSSLGYLAKLPVQSLKIDRSFIIAMLDDPDAATLVRTIISLAHSLRLKVVAEGVETEAQAKLLRLLRCDEMQGYLFSQPLPMAEITAMLRQSMAAHT
ncbi:MAG: PAS domain S-box protein [Betaproteobacteria bacterium]|nr:MAG: PAS domain S-box protein [Betaproteobacteria bacterium]